MHTIDQCSAALQERHELMIAIEKMTQHKKELEAEIKSYLIDEHMLDMFTVNWDKARRTI